MGAWDKEKHSMIIAGETRYFDVYTPAEFDNRTPLPLILSFHGWRDDGDFFGGKCEPDHPFCEWDKEVDARKIFFVRPYGLFKSWNAGMCCAPSSGGFLSIPSINKTEIMQLSDPSFGHPPDLYFGRQIVKYMSKNYAVDTNRVFSVGFSNGGMMSEVLACNSTQNPFAAICSVEGVVEIRPGVGFGLNKCDQQYGDPEKKISVLKLQGTGDPAVPLHGDPVLGFPPQELDFKRWAKRNKCGTKTVPTVQMRGYSGRSFTDCPGNVQVEMVLKSELAHQWTINSRWSSTKYCANFLMNVTQHLQVQNSQISTKPAL